MTREFKSGKPAEDILCTPEAYRDIYDECGLGIVAEESPVGRGRGWCCVDQRDEPCPWTIYVLARK